MEKEFIPYEQALVLKELGFDEPCFAWFILEGDGAKSTLVLEKCPKQDIGLCLAPLYQQAFRWFREKYNLKSWIQEHTTDTFIYEIRPHKLTDYKEGEVYVYKIPEEAELHCLKKLIEIVKHKNNYGN